MINCAVAPEKLANPFSLIAEASLIGGENLLSLDPRELSSVGEKIRLPADGVLLIHLK
jgi:hypothetical protein